MNGKELVLGDPVLCLCWACLRHKPNALQVQMASCMTGRINTLQLDYACIEPLLLHAVCRR
jgi:hypothetical protein